jgi:hypothetical protein
VDKIKPAKASADLAMLLMYVVGSCDGFVHSILAEFADRLADTTPDAVQTTGVRSWMFRSPETQP